MKINRTPLDGLLIIEPQWFKDERGFFLETYQSKRYKDVGICDDFVQDNQSRSARSVLRGMHFQVEKPQSQIVTVIRGCVYDVAVDLRKNSSTFGQWFGVELSDTGPQQIYMAPGFAHGFCVMSDWADLHYKVSSIYDGKDEGGLHWNDTNLGIKWPIDSPIITARDDNYPNLIDLKQNQLPS
jgi:dTDP-4-dehydrorhamnose 3,5-epimerase